VDASPIFEDRILSPFLIAVLPAIILVLKWFWQRKTWFYRTAVIVSACTLFLFMIEDDVDFFTEFHRDGQGFASDGWRDSGTIQAVSGLPSSSTLYSNKMTALYLLAEHPAYILPSATNPATGQPREGYEEDVAMIREQVLGGQSYMVIFYYRDMLDDPEQAEWINDLSEGLPVYLETNDGIIFGKN